MVNVIYVLSILAGIGVSIISLLVAWQMINEDDAVTFQRAGYLFMALILLNMVHLAVDLVEVLKKW